MSFVAKPASSTSAEPAMASALAAVARSVSLKLSASQSAGQDAERETATLTRLARNISKCSAMRHIVALSQGIGHRELHRRGRVR